MARVTGESAIIYVSEPDRLRDYFLRLGAEASIEEGAVRVRHAGDGTEDDTITAYLRSWVDQNRVFASILLDPPADEAGAESRVEQAPPPPPAASFGRPRLGDLLLARGLISLQQLDEALVEARVTNDLLGRVLIRRRFIYGDELARTLADQLHLPYVNLRVVGCESSIASLIPATVGMQFGVLPIGRMSGRLRVAFADPLDDRAKAMVEQLVGEYTIVVADLLEIELAWKSVDPRATREAVLST